MTFQTIPTIVDGDDGTDDFPQATKLFRDQVAALTAGGELGADAAGPTVGTTPLVIDTATIPAPGVAGQVMAWCTATGTKTLATDYFQVSVNINGSARALIREPNLTAGHPNVFSLTVPAWHSVNGLADIVIDVLLTRIGGTGTATVGGAVSLQYLFIPTP